MSGENTLSLEFYKYLCQKIGNEDEVKVRRLTYIIDDLGIPSTTATQITSGSKDEGLQLNGSDIDLMFIDTSFKVYESESDFVPQSCKCILLLMNAEDTHPCFTQLHLVNNHDLTVDPGKRIKNSFLGRNLSSDLYRLNCMEDMTYIHGITKIHGPCISTTTESMDGAWCLKCDKWISQAKQWIIRPQTTWPPLDLISKLISCGVLYVPICYKGSSNEILQWRMFFSVAEKCLIFAFNHTQLLCYALLKIMIKEIVEKHEDLKQLLCSYFVKTLMFWMLEESDPSIWRPDKIITCFIACLKRLIYCVEYSTLLHYFIPNNNLFYLRFDFDKRDKMISILKNLFEKGIYCFAQSETVFTLI
ncbi:cyclic GMP-AMP synthase-like receptor 2 [Mytilus edulis]|uniref:cyclic GMP-AMP synthase-like receptor 2 n=1 Tax=Mytilus edulis TaxID=6550 RepID=UPI0039F07FEE